MVFGYLWEGSVECVHGPTVRLHLMDYGEHYTCNLPNAYGR